ncbi:TPA: hypothetical protein N0F65_009350 [Lagenidium giganteum]|uniref:Pre-mRNA-splicing factor SYF2 n=1 Tax=Lagenidium giganteum TaxID=4803 RepID=A0AAV2Z992_9STRA|nr:TPA: hypothetical protein N0F65_009350 [Lagenidium giganteum]
MSDHEEEASAMRAMTPAQKKLFELRMKVNAGRKANKKEVAAEHERIVNKDKKPQRNTEERRKEDDPQKKEQAVKAHLNDTAEVASEKAKKDAKKEKRKAAFGWDVFNQDSLYKAYKKRLVKLPTAVESNAAAGSASTAIVTAAGTADDELSYGKNDHVEAENLDRMANELEERIKDRKKFSRRRQHYEGQDVDYINDQNRIFNRKASQAFNKYTVEIRQNLERGTAL